MSEIEGIVRQTQELLLQAYKKGVKAEREKYKPAVEKAYQDGFKDGQNVDRPVDVNATDNAYRLGVEIGFQKGVKEASFGDPCCCCGEYKKGLADAWDVVRRIESLPEDGGLTNEEIEEVFGKYIASFHLYREFSAEETINRMEDWARRKAAEVTVGDEVTTGFSKFVVLSIGASQYHGFNEHLTWCQADKSLCEKTGRHFEQIPELLKAMREEA